MYERDDLNKRSAKHANKSTLVARGADTQLGSSCVALSVPLATNVDLWNPIVQGKGLHSAIYKNPVYIFICLRNFIPNVLRIFYGCCIIT